LEQTLKVISKHGTQDDATTLAKRLLPRIQRGLSLSAALASESNLPLYLPGMVRASEVSGALADGLADAARYMEEQANTQSKLLNALTYPLIILVTVIAALVMVLVLVIPSFEPIFAGEEHNLPKITQIVLWLSDMTVNHFPRMLMIFLAGMLSIIFLLKYSKFKNKAQTYALSFKPIRLVEHIELSRVIGVMGMLFHSGVEVSEAVALAANTTRSKRLKQSFLRVAIKLREGASITAALEEVPSLPDDTRALMEVGEHSGQLSKITQRAAHLLEINTYDQIGRMVALATPLSIILLGAAVGLIVGGVMLGILSINQLALRS
jgi:general secretion pathway protein F